MPMDLVVGPPPDDGPKEVTENGAELREDLEKVYQMAREKTGRELERYKKLYDRGKTIEQYQPRLKSMGTG